MEAFQNGLIIVSILLEIAVLGYLEVKAWKTLYTPLNFLMFPYLIVLVFTIAVSGNIGFVEFYYPSVLIWNVGLLLFAIPSFVLAYYTPQKAFQRNGVIKEEHLPQILNYFALFVFLLFLWRFRQTMAFSRGIIGSDEFGEDFCGGGLWGHMRKLTMPLLIILIYYANRKNWLGWILIILLLGINFLYQVKGWIIIPCVCGMAMRLYTGKTKLTFRLFLYMILAGMAVFSLSYLLALVVAGNGGVGQILEFAFGHFFHYFTSGTFGLSADMYNMFPDKGTFEVILCPFVNIANQLIGSEELVSPINPLYYDTGIDLTNVRTYFGTLLIYANPVQFVIYIFTVSTLMYLLKIAVMRINSIYLNMVYFFECSLFAMGWFEFYFFHLDIIEVPVLIGCIYLLVRLFGGDKKKTDCAIDTEPMNKVSYGEC